MSAERRYQREVGEIIWSYEDFILSKRRETTRSGTDTSSDGQNCKDDPAEDSAGS